MALEVRASPSPSPHHSPPHAPEGGGQGAAADPPPPVSPARDEWPEPEKPPSAPDSPPPPLSSAAVVVSSQPRVAAAKYVPPRPASHTDPDPGRGGWYSWNGGRTADRAPRSRPAPAPRRQRAEEVPPPPSQPQAPAPAPRAAPPPAPAPAPAPPPPATRSVDRVMTDIMSRKRRVAALQRAALAARATAAGLCLAALAVLAADTRKGWALDSYNRYSQLRYSEAVNVIGFVYSLIQFADLVRKNKHSIPQRNRDIFDFTMDQVLAYLLISSSSSATARVGDWIDNWGSDPFPNMANGSIVISFLAFVIFAICALISAYNLFRRDL